ncbi:MAG: hypothetical protein H6617_04545 [Bdellovibrionaceae bacterium]|nr:hypothetical protein [Pseudobdellovibrionaceae bacterium]
MLKKYGLSREAFETVYAYYGEHIWEGIDRWSAKTLIGYARMWKSFAVPWKILRASCRPRMGGIFIISQFEAQSVAASMAQELGFLSNKSTEN